MEQICVQITSLEPDSRQRVEAIERSEETRRISRLQEQERLSLEREANMVKRNLKETKTRSGGSFPPLASALLAENSRERAAAQMSLSSIETRASKKRAKRSDASCILFIHRTPPTMNK